MKANALWWLRTFALFLVGMQVGYFIGYGWDWFWGNDIQPCFEAGLTSGMFACRYWRAWGIA